MMPLTLAWTLLTVSLWTSGLSQFLEQLATIRYPEVNSAVDIECLCKDSSCDSAHWFRSVSKHDRIEYLGKCNNANRVTLPRGIDKERFLLSKKSNMVFALRIIGVAANESGSYSCVLTTRNNEEMWRPGIHLRVGETPPTLPPVIKPKQPNKPKCYCPKNKSPKDGCESRFFWALVGLGVSLAVAVIGTLYYFSRLPKKCRHHFVKKRQMT